MLSFGQGLQHPAAIGVAGGEPGSQSGFALLAAAAADRLMAAAAQTADATRAETPVPLPTAGMTMSTGQVELVVSQGGGGYGDPLEREPDLVVADVAEGLVSPEAARLVYGVVMEAAPGYPRLDQGATATRREAIRADRLGGRTPRPPPRSPAGASARPSPSCPPAVPARGDARHAAAADSSSARPPRTSTTTCSCARPPPRPVPPSACTTTAAGVRDPGLLCPSCGRQVDVQVGRADEPVLRAIEPLEPGY